MPAGYPDEFATFQALLPESAVFLGSDGLLLQQNEIAKLGLQRGLLESLSPQCMQIMVGNFGEHAGIAPAIENRVMEGERKLKRCRGALVHMKANQRIPSDVKWAALVSLYPFFKSISLSLVIEVTQIRHRQGGWSFAMNDL